ISKMENIFQPEIYIIASIAIVAIALFVILRQDKATFVSSLQNKIDALQIHLEQRSALLKDFGEIEARYTTLLQSCQQLGLQELKLREDVDVLGPRAGEIENQVKNLIDEKARLEVEMQALSTDILQWKE